MLRAAAVGADIIVMPVPPVQESVNTSLNTSLNTSDVQDVAVGGYDSYTQYQRRLSSSAPQQFNSTGNGSVFSNGFSNGFGNGFGNGSNGSLLHCRRGSSGSAAAAASLSAARHQQQQQKQRQKQHAAATSIQVTCLLTCNRLTSVVVCLFASHSASLLQLV
jgi:hypothetical protein